MGKHATVVRGFAENSGYLARYLVLIMGGRLGSLQGGGDGKQDLRRLGREGWQGQRHRVCKISGTMRGNSDLRAHASRITYA